MHDGWDNWSDREKSLGGKLPPKRLIYKRRSYTPRPKRSRSFPTYNSYQRSPSSSSISKSDKQNSRSKSN